MNISTAQSVATVGPSSYKRTLDEAWAAHVKPREANAPTVISTFCGGGGSSLGYSIAGFHELLAVDANQNAIDTIRLNFPDVPTWHDPIETLTVDRVLDMTGLAPGTLDVLDGSPPCQGFSTAGRRDFDDSRNSLFQEYARLLRGLQPRVFVMENVHGMVLGKMKLIFADILRTLRACGYRVAARRLNAMYFGVPQSRERLIFIGVRDDLDAEPSHPAPTTRPIPVSAAIGDLGNEMDAARGHMWLDESPAGRNTKTYAIAARAKQGEKYAGSQIRGRWDRPAPTLTTGGVLKYPYLRGLHCHPIYTRTYSALELKRLASFPEQFTFAGEWNETYRRVGNSVPPLFMRAIAAHVKHCLLGVTEAV